MKITIYELLGLMKDGNQPKKIKHRNVIYTWGYDCYTTAPESTPDVQSGCSIFARYRTDYILNDEVEIIEEDKEIERFEMCTGGIMGFDGVENITSGLKDKINELIDEVNRLKNKR